MTRPWQGTRPLDGTAVQWAAPVVAICGLLNASVVMAGQRQLAEGSLAAGCSDSIRQRLELETSDRRILLGETIYREDFDSQNAAYWVEGKATQVSIESGKLVLDGNARTEPAVTVFIDQEFSGDLYFGYETEILASNTADGFPSPKDVNNLNTFLYYSDPSGRDLWSSRHVRSNAEYRHYHNLNGYIVTFLNGYLSNLRQKSVKLSVPPGTGRIRLRENPGFILRNEAFSERSEMNRCYLLQFVYYEGELLFFIDGQFQLGFKAAPERRFNRGHFAFRTFSTKMAVDAFEVKKFSVRQKAESRTLKD